MSKRNVFVAVAAAVCFVAAAGGLLASNMGFKLNYRLTSSAATGGVGTGKNTLSLPYIRQAGLNDARQLMLDIGGGSITPVAYVARYNEATDLFVPFTGRLGSGTPFALQAGEGYLVAMNANTNYVVVGSHDPAHVTSLDAPGAPGTGKNFYAPPYNIVAANALQLMQDIGGGVIAPVAGVAQFNKATDLFVPYTGRMGAGVPFALAHGQVYLVSMNSAVPYIASHY